MQGKRIKTIAAFKVSAELHERITSLAKASDRIISNQIIYLTKKGIEAEESRNVEKRLEALEQRLEAVAAIVHRRAVLEKRVEALEQRLEALLDPAGKNHHT